MSEMLVAAEMSLCISGEWKFKLAFVGLRRWS